MWIFKYNRTLGSNIQHSTINFSPVSYNLVFKHQPPPPQMLKKSYKLKPTKENGILNKLQCALFRVYFIGKIGNYL